MNLIQDIKDYFQKKDNNQDVKAAPEGICPNCWGKQEWDSHYYEFNKGTKNDKRDDTYNSFINKIVESNINGIPQEKDSYKCQTCESVFS